MKHNLTLLGFLFIFSNLIAQSTTIEYADELAKKGKFKNAIVIIDELIEANSHIASYYLDKARYLIEQKDYEDALNTLTKAIKILPDSTLLYDARGTLFEAFGLYNEAIHDFTIGLNKANNNKIKSHLLANRGGTKYRIRDFNGSYFDLISAIRLDSTNIDALNNLAAVCDEVNKSNETLMYLEQIILIDSNYAPAFVNIGFKYQELNNHEKAISYFDKAIELSPKEALGYSNRSFSKLKINNLKGAMKDINYSIKLMPTNSYAFKIRALIKIKNGKIKRACQDLNKSNELGYTEQYGNEVEQLISVNCRNNSH